MLGGEVKTWGGGMATFERVGARWGAGTGVGHGMQKDPPRVSDAQGAEDVALVAPLCHSRQGQTLFLGSLASGFQDALTKQRLPKPFPFSRRWENPWGIEGASAGKGRPSPLAAGTRGHRPPGGTAAAPNVGQAQTCIATYVRCLQRAVAHPRR